MRIVPAARGWRWVRGGFALFRKAPTLWLVMLFAYWLAMAMVSIIASRVPVVGAWLGLIATSALIPFFSVSFMVFARELDAGAPVSPASLLSGFRTNRTNRNTLIALGAVYLAATLAVLGASALADGGLLARWMLFGQRPAQDQLSDAVLLQALTLASVAYTPVLMAFWFAPALAAWRNMGATQSLFYSFFASLRNWRPFLVYGIAFALIGGVAPSILLLLALMLRGASPVAASVLMFCVIPAMVMLVPTLFASFYVSYRDVFAEPPATPAETDPAKPS